MSSSEERSEERKRLQLRLIELTLEELSPEKREIIEAAAARVLAAVGDAGDYSVFALQLAQARCVEV